MTEEAEAKTVVEKKEIEEIEIEEAEIEMMIDQEVVIEETEIIEIEEAEIEMMIDQRVEIEEIEIIEIKEEAEIEMMIGQGVEIGMIEEIEEVMYGRGLINICGDNNNVKKLQWCKIIRTSLQRFCFALLCFALVDELHECTFCTECRFFVFGGVHLQRGSRRWRSVVLCFSWTP